MNIERIIAEESALLQFADVWMEETKGEVVEGIVIDRDEYIDQLISIPLYENVKGELGKYKGLISKGNLIGVPKNEQANTWILKHFPTVLKTLEQFLEDPDYCNDSHNKFGAPKKLNTVIRDYNISLNDGKGGFKNAKGDCGKIYQAIYSDKLTEEQLLNSIGLTEQWGAYQQTIGVPRDWRELAKTTIEHFLEDPDYCHGHGGYNKFGDPKKLNTVMRGYNTSLNEGKGGFRDMRGDCRKIHEAIYKDKLTEQELLNSIGMTEQWNAYQQTIGVPRDWRELAKNTIEHFLEDPDYCATNKGGNKFGAPKKLQTVIRDYNTSLNNGKGGFKDQRGDCCKIHEAIRKDKLTEQQLLNSIGLIERWDAYQNSNLNNPYVEGVLQ